ncbi:MAG: gamma-glutamyl-gamma-aminobutyrate hydrolase family protein [Prevotella sp.]|nr:gamma-glutamyl-gamma-aminobutyrate hydrolase family protein [Prevotella sp.]
MKRINLWLLVAILVICNFNLLTSCTNANNAAKQDDTPVRIGIAWRGDSTSISYTSALQSVREAGAVPVPLPLLKSPVMEYDGDQLSAQYTDDHGIVIQEYADKVKADPFAGQDIISLLAGLDGLVFTGGADISPTFYKTPEPWHGIEEEGNCDGRRDVSDYILMAWCLEREPQLPVLCICRGMQMLSIVSGAQMIQDLRTYFAAQGLSYADEHRMEATADHRRDFAVHDVTVTDQSSLLRQIVGTDIVSRVPSWHHQAVRSVEGTSLKVTAVTQTSGIDIIEAVERTDKPFFIGLQYHPEVAVAKHANGAADASRFMDYDNALCYFRALAEQGKKHKNK